MEYDPIKDFLGRLFGKSRLTHRAFLGLLDLFFLRAWYVRRETDRLIRAEGGRAVRVLDAGTGFGQYAFGLVRRHRNVHVFAVDVKQEYLQAAEDFVKGAPEGDRIEFALDDLTRLRAEGPFDLILSVDVMEHIEDDEAVFGHFARVLRGGGHVLINTPSDQGGSDVQSDQDASFIGEHVRDGYNLEELQNKLRHAGLEPVRAFYTYGPYGSFAWRMMIKRPMQMLNRTRLALLLMPFYYLPVLPVGMALHAVDMRRENASGTGVIVVARKP
jgi:SAM-dependent methyltransferase